jgi:hypothetical protein
LANKHPESEAFYARLDNQEIEYIAIKILPGEHTIGLLNDENSILGAGWGTPEPWGVWTVGKSATLSLPCNSKQFYVDQTNIHLSLFLRPFGTQHIIIEHMGSIVYQGAINGEEVVNFPIPVNNCQANIIEIKINISNPKSPLELGQSVDSRQLGIGLTKFSIK